MQLVLIGYVQTHPWRDMLPEETQKQLHFSVLKTMKVQQVTKGESTQVAADLYTQNLKKLFAEVDRCINLLSDLSLTTSPSLTVFSRQALRQHSM